MRNRYLLRRNTIVCVATDSQVIRGAERWRGPPRRPEKAALAHYLGKPRYRPTPVRAARLILRVAEKRAGGGHQGAPKKQPWPAIWGS